MKEKMCKAKGVPWKPKYNFFPPKEIEAFFSDLFIFIKIIETQSLDDAMFEHFPPVSI